MIFAVRWTTEAAEDVRVNATVEMRANDN